MSHPHACRNLLFVIVVFGAVLSLAPGADARPGGGRSFSSPGSLGSRGSSSRGSSWGSSSRGSSWSSGWGGAGAAAVGAGAAAARNEAPRVVVRVVDLQAGWHPTPPTAPLWDPTILLLPAAVAAAWLLYLSAAGLRRVRWRRAPEAAPVPPSDGLRHLERRDPSFDPIDFAQEARQTVTRVTSAWLRDDLQEVRALLSEGMYERLQLQLSLLHRGQLRNVMSDFQVLSTRFLCAVGDARGDTVHLQVRATARDCNVAAGSPSEVVAQLLRDTPAEPYEEVWSFTRPHGESAFVLAEISQASEWRHPAHHVPAALLTLQRRDPLVSAQALEDRALVLFWRWIAARSTGDSGPLQAACAGPPQTLEERVPLSGGALEQVAVGSAEVVDVLPGDQVVVEIRWSPSPDVAGVAVYLVLCPAPEGAWLLLRIEHERPVDQPPPSSPAPWQVTAQWAASAAAVLTLGVSAYLLTDYYQKPTRAQSLARHRPALTQARSRWYALAPLVPATLTPLAEAAPGLAVETTEIVPVGHLSRPPAPAAVYLGLESALSWAFERLDADPAALGAGERDVLFAAALDQARSYRHVLAYRPARGPDPTKQPVSLECFLFDLEAGRLVAAFRTAPVWDCQEAEAQIRAALRALQHGQAPEAPEDPEQHEPVGPSGPEPVAH